VLSDAEREELVALTLRRKTAQALALRARIILAGADGLQNKAVGVLYEKLNVLIAHGIPSGALAPPPAAE
jgi:hypothetical protein